MRWNSRNNKQVVERPSSEIADDDAAEIPRLLEHQALGEILRNLWAKSEILKGCQDPPKPHGQWLRMAEKPTPSSSDIAFVKRLILDPPVLSANRPKHLGSAL